MKNDMTGLLNLAYEIEGLLLLHINRGDEASPEMKRLLVSKAERLLEGLTCGEVAETTAKDDPVGKPVVSMPGQQPAERETEAESMAASALSEEPEDAAGMQLTLDEKLARERAADISKAFTINDKFRFRRELFHGSDDDFNETLDVIGSMSGMDEAEEYFYNDLCWDAGNEDVKEFMAIVAKHF